MKKVILILGCLLALCACTKDSPEQVEMEGTWKLIRHDYSYSFDGEPLKQSSTEYKEENQPVWIITKEDGYYSATGDDGYLTPSTFTFNDGTVLFDEPRLFYYQKEYKVVSLTDDTMEWRSDVYNNHYQGPMSTGVYDVNYLESHTVLLFQRSL